MDHKTISQSNQLDHKLTNNIIQAVLALIILLAGAKTSIEHRFAMNADGISYLDIADAYLRGDWPQALNTYWSPLYSWILLFLKIILGNPTGKSEFVLAHIASFGLLVFATGSFYCFINEILEVRKIKTSKKLASNQKIIIMPDWAISVTGFSLFGIATLELIGIYSITPDLGVLGIYCILLTLLMRISRGLRGYATFIVLGITLAIGYLMKVVLILFTPVFLLISAFMVRYDKKAARLIVATLISFMVIAGPFIVAISIDKNRFTIGDTGRSAYMIFVSSEAKTRDSKTEQLFKSIDDLINIYDFKEPSKATYPPHYELSYWMSGMKPTFHFQKSFILALLNLLFYLNLFIVEYFYILMVAVF